MEQLLKNKNINVSSEHLPLFEEFIKDNSIVESFNIIQKHQTDMLDSWKEKSKIEDIKAMQLVLPNGTVGKPYEFVFDLSKPGLNDIGDYDVIIDDKIGIAFSKENNKISGTLKEAGEHKILFNFKLKDGAEKPFNQKEIKLIVNPDPKSLWKDLPSDKSDPYWKPDSASMHLKFGSKNLVAGSKRGRSHAHEGIFRDDDFRSIYDEETGWGIIVVADGAGSAKYSRRGAQLACETIIDFFKSAEENKLKTIDTATADYLKERSEENQKKLSAFFIEQLGTAAFKAQGKIRDEATAKAAEIRDYSTTLLFALVKRYRDCFVIASFWVGDGGIGIYNKEKNEVLVLGVPDSGEFAGQTRFLTMSEIFADGAYANRVRFKIVEDFTALILMTDGITDPKFQTDANLDRVEKWNDLWADINGNNQDNCKVDLSEPPEEAEADLMTWLDFWSPGNHDDRTLAILY